MIRAHDLTKRYGKHIAINNLDFTIDKGEILGFLGPNGAGKTTTMNIITGYLSASEGSIRIDGIDVLEHPEEVKKKTGYLPEQPPLYPEMTVMEYLAFVGQIKKVSRESMAHDLDRIMDLIKIGDVRKRLIKNLSKGYRQRVGLAQALVGNPPLLILDEPTVGLDPKQIIEIRNLIRELGKEHTIVLSSHILPEVSAVCERVLIMNKGVIVASDTPVNLSNRLTGNTRLSVRVRGDDTRIREALEKLDSLQILDLQASGERGAVDLTIEGSKDSDIREAVFLAMSAISCPILSMKPVDLSLEDIFLQLTTTEQEADN